jgi:hypothetical protein
MRGGDSPVQEDGLEEDEEEYLPNEQRNGVAIKNMGEGRVPFDWEVVTSLQPIVYAMDAQRLEEAQLG